MIYIYTQPGCAPCKRAIKRLEESSIDFEVWDIADDEAMGDYIREDLKATQTPVFERDIDSDYTEWFQGYTDINDVVRLDRWIEEESPNNTEDGVWLD